MASRVLSRCGKNNQSQMVLGRCCPWPFDPFACFLPSCPNVWPGSLRSTWLVIMNINSRGKPLYCNIAGTLTWGGGWCSSASKTLYFRKCHAFSLYHHGLVFTCHILRHQQFLSCSPYPLSPKLALGCFSAPCDQFLSLSYVTIL